MNRTLIVATLLAAAYVSSDARGQVMNGPGSSNPATQPMRPPLGARPTLSRPQATATGTAAGTTAAAKPAKKKTDDFTTVDCDSYVSLPGHLDDAVGAGDGRYLLLSFRKLQKVGVFDMRTTKIVRFVNVRSDDFFVAGGLTRFVVVDRLSGELNRHDLADAGKELRMPLPPYLGGDVIGTVIMGPASEGPLWVYSRSESRDRLTQPIRLFDLETLAALPHVITDGDAVDIVHQIMNQYSGNFTISANGRRITSCAPTLSSRCVFEIGQGQIIRLRAPPKLSSTITMAYDGESLLSSKGRTLLTDTSESSNDDFDVTGYMVAPAYDPGAWFTAAPYGDGTRLQFLYGSFPMVVARLELNEPFERREISSLNQIRRVVYSYPEKTIALFCTSPSRIAIKKFDLDAEAAKSSEKFLAVVSGAPSEYEPNKKWSHQLLVKSSAGKVDFKLGDAPPGMTLSPTGLLEWSPTTDLGTVDAVATVKLEDGIEQALTLVVPAREQVEESEVTTPIGAVTRTASKKRISLKLPAEVNQVAVGGGGRYLVVHMPSLNQVAVIDVAAGQLIQNVPLEDDRPLIAAGATKFVVYEPSRNTITRWAYGAKNKEQAATLVKRLATISMGSASEGPLLAVAANDTDRWAEMINLYSLKILPNQDFDKPLKGYRVAELVMPSSNGKLFTAWNLGSWPSQIQAIVPQGNKFIGRDQHDSADPLYPSADGTVIYTTKGPYSNMAEPLNAKEEPKSHYHFAAEAAGYYLAYRTDGKSSRAMLQLCAQGSTDVLATLKDIPWIPLKDMSSNRVKWALDRPYFLPKSDAVVLFDAAHSRLTIHRFSIDEALGQNDADFLVLGSVPPTTAVVGKPFEYQLTARSNRKELKYRLDAGPPGMTMSPTGLLIWTPDGGALGQHDVAVSVSHDAPREAAQTFQVTVVATAAAAMNVAGATQPAAAGGAARLRDTVLLPGRVDQLEVGAGGRYLVAKLPQLGQVAVIDTAGRKVMHYIPVDDDALIAAGAAKFVVAQPSRGDLSRYDLATGAREQTARLEEPIKVLRMGSSSDGPIYTYAGDGIAAEVSRFLDLQTLKSRFASGGNNSPALGFQPYLNADGKMIALGNIGLALGPTGLLESDRKTLMDARFGRSSSPGIPSADGRVIYSGAHIYGRDGKQISPDIKDSTEAQITQLIPAATGSYYLRVLIPERSDSQHTAKRIEELTADGRAWLHIQGNAAVSVPLADLELPSLRPQNNGLSADRRVVWLPAVKTLVALPPACDRLLLQQFDAADELKKASGDVFFVDSLAPESVAPGNDFAYQIEATTSKRPLKYRLEAGPPGATISPTGLVAWKAPPDARQDQAWVVAIENGAGQEILHSFRLRIGTTSRAAPVELAKSNFTAWKDPIRSAAPKASTPPQPMPAAPAIAELPPAEYPLDAAVDDLIPAGGGRYILLVSSASTSLSIVDLSQRRIVKTMLIDADARVAGGQTKFVVGSPGKQTLTRYDLATQAEEKTVPLAGDLLGRLMLGAASEGPLVVAQGPKDVFAVTLFDLATLAPAAVKLEEVGEKRSNEGRSFAIDARGTKMIWGSDFGSTTMTLKGNMWRVETSRYVHFSSIIDSRGRVLHRQSRKFDASAGVFDEFALEPQSVSTVPAVNGPWEVSSIGGDRLFLTAAGCALPLTEITGPQLPRVPQRTSNYLHRAFELWDFVFPSPETNTLAYLDENRTTLHLLDLNVARLLAQLESDYLLVASVPPAKVPSGMPLRYPIDVRSKTGGVVYRLEAGPEGLTVGADGVVTWNVPAGGTGSRDLTVVSITDASGQTILHAWNMESGPLRPATIGSAAPPATGPTSGSTSPTPPSSIAAPLPKPSATGTGAASTSPAVGPTKPEASRTWTSSDGKFRIEAVYVGRKAGDVSLRRPDGQIINVPVASLSQADQDYLQSRP